MPPSNTCDIFISHAGGRELEYAERFQYVLSSINSNVKVLMSSPTARDASLERARAAATTARVGNQHARGVLKSPPPTTTRRQSHLTGEPST
jgi:hypothetical protein